MKKIIILVSLLISFELEGQNLDQNYWTNSDTLVQQGIKSINAKKYRKAKSILKKAIRKDIINPAGSYYLGICFQNIYRLNHIKQIKSIKAFTEAINYDYLNPKYYWRRGLAYFGQFDYNLAIVDFDRAILLNPKIPEYYFYRGSCLLSATRFNSDSIDLVKCALKDLDMFDSLAQFDTIPKNLIRWNYYHKALAYEILGQDSLSLIAFNLFNFYQNIPLNEPYGIQWSIGQEIESNRQKRLIPYEIFPEGICSFDLRINIRAKTKCR